MMIVGIVLPVASVFMTGKLGLDALQSIHSTVINSMQTVTQAFSN
jgi:hypothetical protein